jgi:predicted PurR-regulated permease PerM
MDRVGDFFQEKTVRRIAAVALFVGALALFHPLILLFVFFVAFERGLGAASQALAARTKLSRRRSVLVVVAAVVVVLGGAIALGAGRVARAIIRAKDHFPQHLAELRESPLYLRAKEHFPDAERVMGSAQAHAQEAIRVVAELGHILAYATIGMILAVVFHLEKEELSEFRSKLDERTLFATVVRWFEHASDAVGVTIQLQLVVAAFNTVTTLPVLLFLGVPHVVPLMILVFFAALIPVVGNFISGAVLSLFAFHTKGWLGVGIFLVLTFVLHKIEAYYLNPRLTARHVRLPGFVIIISLLAFEHLFGFAGLFLSFPFLFVAGRIRAEWKAEDAAEKSPAS